MTHEEYQKAANYWKTQDVGQAKMEPGPLKTEVERYIQSHNTCALATGYGDFVRCTPIEYSYHDGCFWMFSEGGEKFIGLEKNLHVSLAICDPYQGFGNLHGLQVTGKAEIVEPFSERYNAHAGYKKISLEVLKTMLHPMNLICVKPERMEYLCSDFKKQGYGVRQSLTEIME